MGAHRRAHTRSGFTIVELGVSILVIAILIGLLLVGLNQLSRSAQSGAERSNVVAMRIAVEQFKTDFGFAPPLVKDGLVYPGGTIGTPAPIGTGFANVYRNDVAADVQFLQGEGANPDLRFSVYSLSYYLVGVLDADIDGKDGPGFREPMRDGSFRRVGGRIIDPLFDVAGRGDRLVEVDKAQGRFELRDRAGVAYRYYRWLPIDASVATDVTDLRRVPSLLGDPAQIITLRDAEWAIVAAGPNRVFGDVATETESDVRFQLGTGPSLDKLFEDARSDNIVEVGR
ncbi:MAG: hypothetical protein KIT54_05920 [Phycisphaeraceae bacterium]|nr:hypothetical protein [Phycisphaeraceae bacterium]